MKSFRLYFKSFQIFTIILLIIGIYFRFINLEKKVYWIDEVHTSVRSSGYTRTEFVSQLANQQLVGIEDLQKYQRLAPDRDLSDTINALAGNAEHSPLYYIMVRFWMQWFGNNNIGVPRLAPLQTRSLSALISLLVFPCIYWLASELFQSPPVAWMAVALMAVSPFHVLYAQEAREYSLWTVAILLSSASLLWVMRICKEAKFRVSTWVIYAVTVALGFYSHLLFGLIALAHGIYVFVIESFRFTKVLTAYLLASLAGILAFLPWLWIFINDSDGIGGWVAKKLSLLTLVNRWLINLTSIFFDLQIASNTPLFDIESASDTWQFSYTSPFIYLIASIVILVGYSTYFLYCHTRKNTWLFVFILIAVPALTLLLPDLISGGQRSSTGRFLIPCYLGIQLAVAYLLATRITSLSIKYWQQKLWQLVTIAVVSCGIVSCAISSQADTWWNKYSSYYNPQIAHIINQAINPLVISGAEKASRLTSLSYMLEPQVQFLLVNGQNIPKIPDSFSDVFLFRPSTELQSELKKEQKYRLQVVYELGHLWRLQK